MDLRRVARLYALGTQPASEKPFSCWLFCTARKPRMGSVTISGKGALPAGKTLEQGQAQAVATIGYQVLRSAFQHSNMPCQCVEMTGLALAIKQVVVRGRIA